MDSNSRTNSSVFNYESSPLFTRESASTKVLYNTFSTAQNNTAVWTPASGKRIYLTAVETSALAALVVTLNRAGNAPFLTVNLTTSLATFGESFPSPIKFNLGEAITLTTSTSGTMYITLIGYEV